MSTSNGLPPTTAIEVTTHTILRELLRHQTTIVDWNHYLTMARLVARALRMSKSTLIQTGVATHRREGKYRLSYLIPVLIWEQAVTIIIPSNCQSHLLTTELPQLQHWLGTHKPVYCSQVPPLPEFTGLWICDPQSWLQLQLQQPIAIEHYPTIIDRADELEQWAQALLTRRLNPEDWNSLQISQSPENSQLIIDVKIRLMEMLWQRPSNPYNCYVLDPSDREIVRSLINLIIPDLHPNWHEFYQQLLAPTERLVWATIDRTLGTFTLAIAPTNLAVEIDRIWVDQATVFITSAVDVTAQASSYRQELGLDEIATVKFSLDRQTELFQLYIPRWMPMPNTRKFQSVLIDEIQQLLHLIGGSPKFTVIPIQDTPLKAQVAAILAAEWGSRVRVDRADLTEANILVCSWEFWQEHQDNLPAPQLMMIPTLPIPSLEDPLVAAKVNFYKHQKQDWFRLYLLPTGLRILHRAIDPIRSAQGIVAIFDRRIERRSYGTQVLAALSPCARINYPDLSWLDR